MNANETHPASPDRVGRRTAAAVLGAGLCLLVAAMGVAPARAVCGPGEVHLRANPAAESPDSGAELIGQLAPPWSFTRWVSGKPRTLADLRGKVVLLRWWTEGCHYCKATLPDLEVLRERYGTEGLVVIGVFHPKPPANVSNAHIQDVAKQLGFKGPIAFDRDWKTLERYWLDGNPERSWTSVSFLIGKDGVLRWVHGGGEYHPSDDPRHAACAAEYKDLEAEIVAALGQSSAARE